LTRSDSPPPERLDSHPAARRKRATGPKPDEAGETGAPPTSFEEAPAVKRARRVEELRDIVDSGEYRPDPGQIAESMLENERS
jgi:anti-sigma28 factor (negative regulator of flagellin synthesis)